MWSEITSLWQSLRDPEYAHLLLEPLPLYGLGVGLILLTITTLTRERHTRLAVLLMMMLCALSVAPYLSFRLAATPRILATRPVAYGPVIEAQTGLRQSTAWAFYLAAAGCALAAAMSRTKHFHHALAAAALLSLMAFWLSLWLHKKECELYHPNILKQAGRSR
ncbi:MAG: hypothetical protein LDL31_04315 [Prosthecobacter sp.]|jgi:hypothetical protein|nr:hypothetical protein [Prosthecobacter sp.]